MIRLAVMEDLPGINVLHEQLHIQHIGYRPDIFAPIEQPVFDTLMIPYIEKPDKDILISENGGRIDGYAAVSVCDTSKGAGEILPFTFIEVNELCVAGNAQGRGIGTALLDSVKQYARDRGAKFVELGVNAQNTGAQEFYKANGMFVKNYKMQFRIE
ncbi:MAG: GNAT family N-acetyltransferase [Ruminiclostridium sp.]|nr:GNAT family N-acetyltransferase [Ruminiclostridium sp.]